MQAAALTCPPVSPASRESATLETTLYELVEAVSEEAHPTEDWLVAEIVLHLLDTGNARFTR